MPKKLYLVGLLQALGVALYCLFVAGIFSLLENFPEPDKGIMAPAFMLLFLVFSAGVTGATVFGYAVYLTINKEIKKAVQVLLYTFLFCLILGVIFLGLLAWI